MKKSKSLKTPIIAVSGCILGNEIRYNGGHTKLDWVCSELSQISELMSFCPELNMGMGVPREPIRLYYDEEGKKQLIGTESQKNYTVQAEETAKVLIDNFKKQDIDGIVWQAKSPSCGMERVKLYNPKHNIADRRGEGIFVSFVKEAMLGVPMEDSGRLHDPLHRERFIKKVLAYQEFKQLDKSIHALELFHRSYKYILMELSPENQKELGRVVANYKDNGLEESYERYQKLFQETLNLIPKPGRRLNVLQHLLGYLKKVLGKEEKENILEIFKLYQEKKVSYQAPIELLRFLVQKYRVDYLLEQKYFNPAYRFVQLDIK